MGSHTGTYDCRSPRLPPLGRFRSASTRPGMFLLHAAVLPKADSPYFACNPSIYETRFVILCCTTP